MRLKNTFIAAAAFHVIIWFHLKQYLTVTNKAAYTAREPSYYIIG